MSHPTAGPPAGSLAPNPPPSATGAVGRMSAEAVYHALVDSLTEHAVVALDGAGCVATWNIGAERLTGYTSDEARGLPIERFYPPTAEAAARARGNLARALAEGRAEDDGWRVRRDGSRYWTNTVITPLRDGGGAHAGYAVVVRDETVRQAAADALAESRARLAERERYLQALLDTQPEYVKVVAPDGTLLDMNAAGLAMLEAESVDTVRGTPARTFVAEPYRAAFDARHAEAFHAAAAEATTAEAATLEFELVGLRGGRRWVESRAVALRDGAARAVAVLSVARDITARRAAEAVRRSEELFHGVVALASDAIVTVDAEQRIVLYNRGAEETFGYAEAEAVGQSLDLLLPAGVRAAHRAEHLPAFARGHATSRRMADRREVYGRRKGGEEFPAEVAISRSTVGGQVHYTAIVRDVSEQRRLTAALRAGAEELARSNAELEQFAYVASHDLQEPLRMVASYTQLLAKRYQGQLDARADQYIHYAVDGARRMQALVDDLLALSRVGTRGRAPAPVESGAAAARALATLRPAAEAAGARVTVGALPAVLGDPGQLEQLFQNLVGNALKFARPGRAPAVAVAAEGPDADGAWTFAVRDDGIGLEMRHAERIFAMFQRLHTRDEYEGTGIGLAICKKIVERHGGRIWVESAAGAGAAFYFTLPGVPA